MARGYRKLGRTSAQRKALLRDLVTDLIINERIETTEMKAKELKRLAEKELANVGDTIEIGMLGFQLQAELEAIKKQLKQLIIVECDKEDELSWEEIEDDEPLFGKKSNVGLDSLDALQLALVLKEHFGIKVEGSKESRKHLHSINSIVDYIQAAKS